MIHIILYCHLWLVEHSSQVIESLHFNIAISENNSYINFMSSDWIWFLLFVSQLPRIPIHDKIEYPTAEINYASQRFLIPWVEIEFDRCMIQLSKIYYSFSSP
jgi:hypothetical protein